ncbi:hypothetical protein AB7M75_006407 [Bradyrhizobium ottawaense]
MREPALRVSFEPRGLLRRELSRCLRHHTGQIELQRGPDEQARIEGRLLDAGRLQPCPERAPRTLDIMSGIDICRQWSHPACHRG